jgi:translation initiation factor 2 subunit 1
MEKQEIYEEGLVMCIVDRIESNTVFVKLENGKEGTLIISEIAPGRIKNLREYVVPNKKILCKVLRVQGDHINLSLRRVSSKERKDFMESYNQELTLKSAFKQVLKDKSNETQEKIKEKFSSLKEYVENAKQNSDLIKEYIPKEFQELIEKIINKKQKDIEVKKTIKVKSLAPDGLIKIKNIFSTKAETIKITYLAAGLLQIKSKAEDYKKAEQKLSALIQELEKRAKQNSCEFEVLSE